MNYGIEFYQKLMDNGLVIWQANDQYVLQKIPTHANPAKSISNEVTPHVDRRAFATYQEAIDYALYIIDPKTEYQVFAMYDRGLGREQKTLENVTATSFEAAQKIAHKMGKKIFEESLIEVRVRPIDPK